MTLDIGSAEHEIGDIRLQPTTADGCHHLVLKGSRRGMQAVRDKLHKSAMPDGGYRVEPATLVPPPFGDSMANVTADQSALATFLLNPELQRHRLPASIVKLLSMTAEEYSYYQEIRFQERLSLEEDDHARADFMNRSAEELAAAATPAPTEALLARLPTRSPESFAVAQALAKALSREIADWPGWMDRCWGITETHLVLRPVRDAVFEAQYSFKVAGNPEPMLTAIAGLHPSLTAVHIHPDGSSRIVKPSPASVI